MTGQEALRRGVAALRAVGIEEPQHDAELLLRHALRQDRAFLYLHLPDELTDEQEAIFLRILRQRLERRPAAYLTGIKEFYGIDFYVAPGVLIPRPETELLVDESCRLLRARAVPGRAPIFVDVGVGCGAIALAVARETPNARCIAIDRSPAALAIAALNARRPQLAGRVELRQGDLLQPLIEPADVIAANLPYIPTALWTTLPPEIREHEPREALDGGEDGLEPIRRLIAQAPARLQPHGALLLEVGAGQAAAVDELLQQAFPLGRRYVIPDLAGIDRVAAVDLAAGDLPPRARLR